jgi:hypothetical protein
MAIIRPRLNDFHGLTFTQEEVSFAIPFLEEDIPLYLDPFLLWKSPSQQDNALHADMIASFNSLGIRYGQDSSAAIDAVDEISECDEVGLGTSKSKHGKRMGQAMAERLLKTFGEIPQLKTSGYTHLEEAQLLVESFSKDRISDIACNLIKSHLIDYTIQKCKEHGVPTEEKDLRAFDRKKHVFETERISVPVNPISGTPILLVPKRWLRYSPWLNLDDYFNNYLATSERILKGQPVPRQEVLDFNRRNFDAVQAYVATKQAEAAACKNDPLFTQIPVLSTKRKLGTIRKLPTGAQDAADRKYEDALSPMLATMLYPELDFAKEQSRTDSGVLIRDLIFYNNTSDAFLKEIYEEYGSRQLVVEMKNVKEVEREHINQLNRYMSNELGRFGVIFTRKKAPAKIFKNIIDLWSGQRRCILILDDSDLEVMCQLYESKQRRPIDVIKKKYVEFKRSCPS